MQEACRLHAFPFEWINYYTNEPPRRKRRGINRKILNAPRGGELNPRPPQAD
jgi:hypothetical protein